MTIKPDSEIASPLLIEGLINRLEDWRDQLRQGEIKRRLKLKAPDQVDQRLVKELRQLHIQVELTDIDQVETAIKVIQEWLKTAPIVHLTFSTPPSSVIQSKIIDCLHKEIDASVLADFRVDNQVAAGFLLRTKNRMFDFSANGLLWQHRGQIGELVKHV